MVSDTGSQTIFYRAENSQGSFGAEGGLSQREVGTPFSIPPPPDFGSVGDILVLLLDYPAQIDQTEFLPHPSKLSRQVP